MTLEQYLEKYFAFRTVGLCQENEDTNNNQRRRPLFRQFTTIIKIHIEIRCEKMNSTEKTQNGSCVIKLITIES